MDRNQRILRCKSCGKEISVPSELDSFNCVYCGAKLSRQDYFPVSGQRADPADLEFARSHIFDCIRDYPDYWKNFERQHYAERFRAYRDGIAEPYRVLDRYLCAAPDERQDVLNELAKLFLTEWERYHREDGKRQTKGALEKRMFETKLTLCFIAVPAIRDLGLSIGEDYTAVLRNAFVAAYPKNAFETMTFDELSAGFRKRKLCFITAAVCEAEGKPDDCAELTAFRAFRDGWLSQTPEGRALVNDYYEVAPSIVQIMKHCDDAQKVCRRLRRQYLEPCYQDLQAGRYSACRDRYVSMVNELRNRYSLN